MSTETAGKSGVLLMQEQMGMLVEGIQTLLAERQERKDQAMLLADVRDVIQEAAGALHSQGADILLGLQDLQHPTAPQPPVKHRWLSYGLGVLAGIVVMGAVWFLWPADPYRGFAVALDTAIAQHYPQLPKAAQESLEALYKRHGFQSPSTRVKGSK